VVGDADRLRPAPDALTMDLSRTEYDLLIAGGPANYKISRKLWEGAQAFAERIEWIERAQAEGVDGAILTCDSETEAREIEQLSTIWYNMKFLGCHYDAGLMDRAGNPQTLVTTQPKKGMTMGAAVHAVQRMAGTRQAAWERSVDPGFPKGGLPPGVRRPPGVS
jgi:hypothetical protein